MLKSTTIGQKTDSLSPTPTVESSIFFSLSDCYGRRVHSFPIPRFWMKTRSKGFALETALQKLSSLLMGSRSPCTSA